MFSCVADIFIVTGRDIVWPTVRAAPVSLIVANPDFEIVRV